MSNDFDFGLDEYESVFDTNFDYNFDCSDESILKDSTLTLDDLCDKVKSVFETIVKIPVKVSVEDIDSPRITLGENDDGVYCSILLSDDVEANSPIYTQFNHEMSHYAFEGVDRYDVLMALKSCLNEIPLSQHDKALELYKRIFDTLEDQRVESIMGSIYLGVGKRFQEARREEGKTLQPMESPAEYLNAVRCYKDNLILDKNAKVVAQKIMKRIEKKDKLSTVVLAREYIKEIVNPWILDNIEEPENESNGDSHEYNNEIDPSGSEPTPELQNAFESAYYENRHCDHKDKRDPTGKTDIDEETIKQIEEKPDDILEQEGQKMQKHINDIKGEIEKNALQEKSESTNPHSDNINVLNPEYSRRIPYNIDTVLARGLNKQLQLLQEKKRKTLSDVGDSINIQAYINMLAKGYGDVFNADKKKNSCHIMIGVDVSGSMNNDRIKNAQNMLATLFKSVENINSIKMEAYTWSGDSETCAVMPIKNLKDCELANCSHSYGGTPTDLAIYHGISELRKSLSKQKLLIILTDGYPDSDYSCQKSGDGDGITYLKKQLKQARTDNNISTIAVGFSCGMSEEHFNEIFDNSIVVRDIKEAREQIVRQFKTTVTNVLK
jgi:uncharacterized protein YegL